MIGRHMQDALRLYARRAIMSLRYEFFPYRDNRLTRRVIGSLVARKLMELHPRGRIEAKITEKGVRCAQKLGLA